MSDDERMGVVTHLAANPEAGISLGGGLQSLRDISPSVIASEARQSRLSAAPTGLLRFARNDDRMYAARSRRIWLKQASGSSPLMETNNE
jgi:hypothetical protein